MVQKALPRQGDSSYNIKNALFSGMIALQRAHIGAASLDARLLLQHVLGATREELLVDEKRALTSQQYARYLELIDARCRRQPVSQLVGMREFWGMAFRVTGDTLDPRADSETLIEAVLAWVPGRRSLVAPMTNDSRPMTILDLGTGTGCLLLALLAEYPNATGCGVDISRAALDVAAGNARALDLQARTSWIQSCWKEALAKDARFDVVISNPPYIKAQDIEALEPEVKQYEPHLALDGGADGLEAYRQIIPGVSGLLAEDGIAVVEIGAGQQDEVGRIALKHGLQVAEIRNDLNGIARCLVMTKHKP